MERFKPDLKVGLTSEQVILRQEENLVNYNSDVPTKTIGRIVIGNIVTLFNILNAGLAFLILMVGAYKNLLFMGGVIINTLISIIQEIRSKRTIDKLSIISEPKVTVLRDKKEQNIAVNKIVLDDITILKSGNQVVVDCIIKNGFVEVNEAFITGESDPVLKKEGETILSGSFIISGKCLAQVEHIGDENYTSNISKEAKYIKKVNSILLTSLNKIIKILSIIIIPVGIFLFCNQFFNVGNDFSKAIVNSVAAIIAMIPEGLVLLTSTVLAVSVIRLSKQKVLVQQIYCIETLARVDTICFDKTGTLTKGIMEVKECISLTKKEYDINKIMSEICGNTTENNLTMLALSDYYNTSNDWEVKNCIPFSSERKYSSTTFEDKGTYLLGAPDIILKEQADKYNINEYSKSGRVLLLARQDKKIEPLCLILVQDQIRESALNTINYFKKEGVDVKIISGDNPNTVLGVAHRLGLKNLNHIDVSSLTEKELVAEIDDNTIFGRVNPSIKKSIIKALKAKGHTVAMIGDGVNDVLALKEADCSIAIKSGSDATRNVSELVLLNDNFDSLPSIVNEGRRTINNIERSASLFIVKTIFALLLAVIFGFIPLAYPFIPIQFTLTSVFTIGIPSLILALEPNNEKIKGNFFTNIFAKALPTSLTIGTMILMITFLGQYLPLEEEQLSTISVLIIGFLGFIHVYRVSKPLTKLRFLLLITMIVAFLICTVGLKDLFSLEILNYKILIPLGIMMFLSILLIRVLVQLFENYLYKYFERYAKK